MKKIDIPVVVEPGSQPASEDGVMLDYMKMPAGVSTYAMPVVPEPEEVEGLDERDRTPWPTCLPGCEPGKPARRGLVYSLDELDAANRELINQVLGAGEVSIRYENELDVVVQEAVLAGVWRVQTMDKDGALQHDAIEIADIPTLVKRATFEDAAENVAVARRRYPADRGQCRGPDIRDQ